MKDVCIAFFDTETTGLEPETNEIVQLGYIIERGSDVFSHSEICDPGMPIPQSAINVHGIKQSQVDGREPARVVINKFTRHLAKMSRNADKTVLCGYNVKFDIDFLAKHWPKLLEAEYIDVLALARRNVHDSIDHKLVTIYEKLIGSVMNAHDAMDDTRMTMELYKEFSKQLDMGPLEMIAYLKEPVELKEMPFGKFKGVEFKNIPTSYLKWMRSNLTLDPDLTFSLDKRLSN